MDLFDLVFWDLFDILDFGDLLDLPPKVKKEGF
jgi:hypothetical protein